MDKRRLGRSDLFITPITMGTMTFGEQNTEAEGHAQLDRAFDYGINILDTAELYAIPPKAETQGSTERIVGSWLKARGNRDKVIVATKVVGRSEWPWFRDDRSPTRVNRAQVMEAVDKSLKRLQTDYIDLYQIHWPDREVSGWGTNPTRFKPFSPAVDETPIEEISAIMGDLVKAGKIRQLGLSNESPYGAMRFVFAAEKGIGPRPVSIQNAYNLVNRTWEGGLAEIDTREQIGLLAYSPLAQGYLTGKYRDGALPKGSRKQLFNRLDRYEKAHADVAINAYVDLAKSFGIDPATFAVAFTINQPCCLSSIIGATTLPQLEACLKAAEVTWTKEMQAAVDDLHQKFGNPCP
ncbi:aldo/keto reductase [Oryzibacter oryziterrae]|uniref:aldo/keto reductase n=1 Tax=Oryzibacter oryziterrae TaxID=2766474 RepID=UPI001F1BF99E|nr:aldo/keto reductase [Oryzibacter oryziterrae]